jgi:hypothetical protein
MHQQYLRVRSHLAWASQIEGHRCANMCITHRFKGSIRPDRKRMYSKRGSTKKYLAFVRRMENYFRGFTVEYIERNKNTDADNLAKAAARNTPIPTYVFFQVIEEASIKIVMLEPRLINIIEGED